MQKLTLMVGRIKCGSEVGELTEQLEARGDDTSSSVFGLNLTQLPGGPP